MTGVLSLGKLGMTEGALFPSVLEMSMSQRLISFRQHGRSAGVFAGAASG